MNNWIKIVVGILIVLFLIIGFFGGRFYINKIVKDNFLKGQEDIVLKMVSVATQCQPIVIPLNEEQNMTLVAVECFK